MKCLGTEAVSLMPGLEFAYTSDKKTSMGSKAIGYLGWFELVFHWKKMPLCSRWNFHFNH